MAGSDSDIHEVLFDLSKSIAGHSDLETLCRSLADSLSRVVAFDVLALALHDPPCSQLRLRALSAKRTPLAGSVAIPDDDPVAITVWKEQKPLVLTSLGDGSCKGESVRVALAANLASITLVPLSNGDRRLGVLGFGFEQPYRSDEAALRFLQRVASEFAVTVDGYLTRNALSQERDRMRVLFEITTAIVSKLPMDELLSAISEQLSKVVAHDSAFLGLLDRATGEILIRGLHSPNEDGGLKLEETSVSADGLPAGEAITTCQPVVDLAPNSERFHSPLYRKCVSQGYRSGCAVPLQSGHEAIGVLNLVRHEEPFTAEDVDLLVQVGRQVAIAIENAVAYRKLSDLMDRLATEKLCLENDIRFDQNIGNMIGESPAFQAAMHTVKSVAPTSATVLIQGETGTGKELIARAIHDLSPRAKRPFIKVNCAAIPAALLESEFFGHEKGAFTGAFAQKIGRFELAHQGTLFLDEIGEIPLELQAKLLRAIQEQELERVGGTRTLHVDIRYIAATNRNLRQMVDEGKFRSDLYYRLHVFPLVVPPLRERREDIPLLVRYFTQTYATRMGRQIEEIPSSSIDALTRYDWPGNIRELQNVIERSVILSSGRVLQVALPEIPASVVKPIQLRHAEEERGRILEALRACSGKISGPDGAAERLGIRRTTLQSRMKRLNIERRFS
jgi:formate hydrogenlyase transcriptional activator